MKQTLLDLFETFKQEHPMKKVYLDFLQNFEFSLEDRWEVFCAAPSHWRKRKRWVFHSKVFPYIDWHDDFYKDRYACIDLLNIVELMGANCFATQDKIDAFKEELLAENLGSFDNDW